MKGRERTEKKSKVKDKWVTREGEGKERTERKKGRKDRRKENFL